MYSAFKSLLEKLEESGSDAINFRKEDPKIVLGVLFLVVIKADGKTRPEELHVYQHLLDDYLGVREDEMHLFEAEVSKRMRSIPNLEELTDSLKDLPQAQKEDVLNYMRKISISDKEFHEAELTIVSRAKKLLGLDDESSLN